MSDAAKLYANKGDLTNGSVSCHLIRLSVPMIWGIAAIISFQLVDTYFVSLLGTESLAALSFTFPVNYFIFSFTVGFGIAMSSVVSRLIGAEEEDTLKRVVTHGLILSFVVGCVIAMLGIIFHDLIFTAMGADSDMLSMVREYMIIWFAGSVFVTLPLVGNAAIRATGDSLTPALIMGVAAGVNVVLDPLLIFGLYGFPRLELYGAAIATVIANMIAALTGLYVIFIHKNIACSFRDLRLNLLRNSAKRLLFIALPIGAVNSLMPLVNAVIISFLSVHGAEAVAGFGIVHRIEAFAFITLMAVSVGMAPIIGQNWGAQKFDRVNETLKLAIGFNVLWSICVAIILFVFARPIAGMFSEDPLVVETVVLFFLIVPPSYAFGNLIKGWSSAFNAIGMPQHSVIMIIGELVFFMLPATYLGHMVDGVRGVFIAIATVNVVAGIGFHLWCRHRCLRCEKNVKDTQKTMLSDSVIKPNEA